jgi:hypothetical protein
MKILALLLTLGSISSTLAACTAPTGEQPLLLPRQEVQARDSCEAPPPKLVSLAPSFCSGQQGFYWNGSACRAADDPAVHCACDLSLECALFQTQSECEAAHAQCR